ncbi:enoyl-CoA hydratase/isomerase family protein [Pseudomonas sp. NCCP-436]|uniref:enoyl-CoA hydratase/isomerase family protein n=1 Tax=Pseudomonas sp. NCCP-436 TaxID=2842481 RepID=UPI001C7FF704|nr:enoyl-CoA hydratase/isomerase family protein [Pseudomonas sp. NCCP-436]GIZ13756.1 crotonase [Pseudomonas sp. NCCP-436]
MSEHEQPVLTEVRNGIGHLILNRPAGLNALSLPMIRMLSEQLRAWEQDTQVLAVVLRANGEKAFCAGGDIRMLYESHLAGDTQHFVFFEEEYRLDQYIHAYSKPILALMDGFVLGGGMGLVQGATFRVISERARMGMPETGIGFYPDVGGSYFLPRLPGKLGIYLAMTGNQVRAADALYCGLADWCLKPEQLSSLIHCLNNMNWTYNPREDLRSLLATLAKERLPGAELEGLREAIDEHFAHDSLAAIVASLQAEKRLKFADWASATLGTLRSRSPLAVAVTLELMQRGRQLSLAECFEQEMALNRLWFERGDLIEGVRALLIDKDKAPRWQLTSLDQVQPELVQSFFATPRQP